MTVFSSDPVRYRGLLGFVAAWVFLNLFMIIDLPLSRSYTSAPLRPSLDVWALLLALCLLAAWKVPFRARVYLPLTGLLIFGRLFRIGDVVVPVYFNRPFNLYIDVGYLPGLGHLLMHSFTPLGLVIRGAAAAGLLAALGWALWQSLRTIHAFFGRPAARRGFLAVTVAMVLVVGADLKGFWPRELSPPAVSIAPRVAAEAVFIANIRLIRRQGLSAVKMAEANIPDYGAPLAGLKGGNVYLFLVESYGETLFGNPAHRAQFAPTLSRFAEALERGGYAVCSRYMRSPTFGGGSWLAFGTLESGVWLPSQLHYDYLLTSRVPPLASYFEKAGYRTVSVMPGTTMPWPEGRYFGYQKDYYAQDLNYRGPAFGFAPMPDQFVLDRIYRTEILNQPKPLFIRYVLVSTHAPFHRQPPFVPDWNGIGDGAVYQRLEPVVFPNNWPDLTKAFGAYRTSIDYEFQVLGDYLTHFDHGDALVVILGDHQPNAHITGPDAPYLVPVHVISRAASNLEPFRRMGFVPGVVPPEAPPFGGMQDFMPRFLTAFSR
jgi:hypothetical protein